MDRSLTSREHGNCAIDSNVEHYPDDFIGCKDKAKTRPILADALRDYETASAPVIAFDITAGAYRVAAHVLHGLLT